MKRQTFEEWMSAVDAILGRFAGVGSADLPDLCYADLYEDEYSPKEAAVKAIKNADGDYE